MSWTRVSSSRSNSVVVSPSTPLAPRRFICRQVSLRNAGVSRCANEVKRSVRSAFALAAICSSCVDIRFLLLSVGDVALAQLLDLRRRFPMCAAFPRAEYYQRLRLPRQHRPSSGWSFQSAYSPDHVKTVVDLPGSVTLPSPSVPCSQTPPESPAPSPLAGAYWCLPRVRPCRPPVATITRLHRFTCVTARTSLCLRLAHVVASISPRLDSRWSGSFSLPGRELHPLEAPGFAWRAEERSNVQVEHPVHLLAHDPDVQGVQRVVLAAPRPEP